MKNLIIYFSLLTILGCQPSDSDSTQNTNDDFEIQFHISGEEINEDIFQNNFFKDIISLDSQLILTSNAEPFVTVMGPDTVKQFIKAGNGPDELPNQFLRLSRNFYNGSINVFHKSTGKHYLLNTLNGDLNFIGNFSINYINLGYLNRGPLKYIGIGYFKKRYGIADSTGDVIEEYLTYPLSENLNSTSINAISMAYQGEFKKHPTKNLFYSATLLAPIFEIIKYDDSQITKVFSWYQGYPKIKDQSNGNTITLEYEDDCEISFVNSSCTEKYIYLLYSGKEHGKRNQRSIDPYLSNQVLVFDWEGNKVCKLILDREVKSISVDENDQVLYSLFKEKNSLQEGIMKFDLKQMEI